MNLPPTMNHRPRQVESLLKRAVSDVLIRHLSDPRVAGIVSITKVEVTDDLRDAQIYVSVLPAKFEKRTLHALNHATGHIVSLLRKMVALRTVPHLQFRLDKSLKKQATVLEAIKRGVAREQTAAAQRIGSAREDQVT